MNIQLAKVSDTMKTMNKSDAMKQTFSLSKMVKTVTKDIRDVAIPLQLCCSPCHVEMGVKAPTSSVTSARKCILIGHRGAKDIEKENTLRSFYAAIDTKCDMVEFDITVTAHGEEVVCLHDYFVDTGEWVRDLDVNTFKQKFPDTPFLLEVLQDEKILKSGIQMYLDLKQPGVVPILIFMLSKAIREWGWSADRIFLASHVATTLLEFIVLRRGFPELHPIRVIAIMGHVPMNLTEDYEEMGCYAVSLEKGAFSAEFIDDAHRRGLHVYMYTVNSVPFAKEMIKRGVDGICTDTPHVVGEAVRAHNCEIIVHGVQLLHSKPHDASSSLINSLYDNADKARINEVYTEAQKLLDRFENRGGGGNDMDDDIRNLRAIVFALEPYVR